MRGRSFVAACVIAAIAIVEGAVVAAHASSAGSDLVRRVNAERTSRGLRPLAVAGDLASIAQRHAARMAARHTIFHNPSLSRDVCCWRAIGENVGMDSSVSSVHARFMRSSMHRSVILNPAFNQIGIGVSWEDGRLYVDEVFVARGSAPAPRVRPRASRSYSRPAPPPPPPKPRRPTPQTLGMLLRLTTLLDEPAPRTSIVVTGRPDPALVQ